MCFLTLFCNVTLSLYIYIEANECYLNKTLQPTLGRTFIQLELTREAASSNAPTRQLTRVVDKTAFLSVACLFLIFILEKKWNVRRTRTVTFGEIFLVWFLPFSEWDAFSRSRSLWGAVQPLCSAQGNQVRIPSAHVFKGTDRLPFFLLPPPPSPFCCFCVWFFFYYPIV